MHYYAAPLSTFAGRPFVQRASLGREPDRTIIGSAGDGLYGGERKRPAPQVGKNPCLAATGRRPAVRNRVYVVIGVVIALAYLAFLGVLLVAQSTPAAERDRLLTDSQQVSSLAEEGALLARATARGESTEAYATSSAWMLHESAQQAAMSLRGLKLAPAGRARAQRAAAYADALAAAFADLSRHPTPSGAAAALPRLHRIADEASR